MIVTAVKIAPMTCATLPFPPPSIPLKTIVAEPVDCHCWSSETEDSAKTSELDYEIAQNVPISYTKLVIVTRHARNPTLLQTLTTEYRRNETYRAASVS
jgi:hypothetical protein